MLHHGWIPDSPSKPMEPFIFTAFIIRPIFSSEVLPCPLLSPGLGGYATWQGIWSTYCYWMPRYRIIGSQFDLQDSISIPGKGNYYWIDLAGKQIRWAQCLCAKHTFSLLVPQCERGKTFDSEFNVLFHGVSILIQLLTSLWADCCCFRRQSWRANHVYGLVS